MSEHLPQPGEPQTPAELAWASLMWIASFPGEWNQWVWARHTPCGTQYCLAGRALWLAGGAFYTEMYESRESYHVYDVYVESLAQQWREKLHGVKLESLEPEGGRHLARVPEVASALLELEPEQVDGMFRGGADFRELVSLVKERFGPNPYSDAGDLLLVMEEALG